MVSYSVCDALLEDPSMAHFVPVPWTFQDDVHFVRVVVAKGRGARP